MSKSDAVVIHVCCSIVLLVVTDLGVVLLVITCRVGVSKISDGMVVTYVHVAVALKQSLYSHFV